MPKGKGSRGGYGRGGGRGGGRSGGRSFYGKGAKENRAISKIRTDEDIARENGHDHFFLSAGTCKKLGVGDMPDFSSDYDELGKQDIGVMEESEEKEEEALGGDCTHTIADDSWEGGELRRRAEFSRKLWMWEFGQNDPKRYLYLALHVPSVLSSYYIKDPFIYILQPMDFEEIVEANCDV